MGGLGRPFPAPWPQSAVGKNYAARLRCLEMRRSTDDGDGEMANSKCSANFNWLGPFVYPFVLIYLHVICCSFVLHIWPPLAHSSRTLPLFRPLIFFGFSSSAMGFPCFFLLFLAVLLGSRLSARMPVTYGCYVHYQYALYGSSCRFIFSQRFSPTCQLGNTNCL